MNALEQLAILPAMRAISAGVLIAGLYWMIFYDSGAGLEKQAVSMRNSAVSKRNELNAKKVRLRRSQEFESKLRTEEEAFSKFSSYIPESLTVADMMGVISREAKAAGVNIVSIEEASSSSSVESELTESVGVEVQLRGSFPQNLLFLSYLSRLDTIFTVNTMDFSSKVKPSANLGDNEKAIVEFKANISGYRYTGSDKNPVGG